MAGSVELKLEEFSNDDDACAALLDVAKELDDIVVPLEDGEYNEASSILDDQINKLQAVKNYVDSKLE